MNRDRIYEAAQRLARGFIEPAAHTPDHARRLREQRSLRRLCRDQRAVVLTYDDGPTEMTPRVLDLLAAHDAKATFFALGCRAEERPELMTRIARARHEIACHGSEHRNAWRVRTDAAVSDLDQGYEQLRAWIDGKALYRPPYGKATSQTRAEIERRGAALGWWTIDTRDTWATPDDPREIVERVRRQGGGVVLMHDAHRNGSRAAHVLEVTDRVLSVARHEGLGVRVLSDVLKRSPRCVDGGDCATTRNQAGAGDLLRGRALGAVAPVERRV